MLLDIIMFLLEAQRDHRSSQVARHTCVVVKRHAIVGAANGTRQRVSVSVTCYGSSMNMHAYTS